MQANQKYGIEIEGYSELTRSELAEYLTQETGIEVQEERRNHVTKNYWKVVSDGSIETETPNQTGFELVSPILVGEQGLAQAHKLLTCLQTFAEVNHSCGLHVHINAADWDLQQFKDFSKAYIHNQDVLDSLQPLNRRQSNGGACLALPSTPSTLAMIDASEDLSELSWELTTDDRYYKVNFTAFWRQQTIEVRHHAGSVNPDVVCNWVRLVTGMAQNASKLYGYSKSLPLLDRLQALCVGSQVIDIPTSLKGLKAAVMGRLGLSDSKAVKKWANDRGIKADLRTKAGWSAILKASMMDSIPDSESLFAFYADRAYHYSRYSLVLI